MENILIDISEWYHIVIDTLNGSTFSISVLNYYYYYLKRLAMQGREREIDTQSVRTLSVPTLPSYRGKEEKGKIVEDKKGESNNANKKALDLLLKPANPTPSNTGPTRSFQRDTERRIKVLRYC